MNKYRVEDDDGSEYTIEADSFYVESESGTLVFRKKYKYTDDDEDWNSANVSAFNGKHWYSVELIPPEGEPAKEPEPADKWESGESMIQKIMASATVAAPPPPTTFTTQW